MRLDFIFIWAAFSLSLVFGQCLVNVGGQQLIERHDACQTRALRAMGSRKETKWPRRTTETRFRLSINFNIFFQLWENFIID
jgi:hypothetical protein